MYLFVNTDVQQLYLIEAGQIVATYPISTASKGLGEVKDSEQTPRGWHLIRAKIGQNSPINTVFAGRRPTGEIYSPELSLMHPGRDWILSRIMWLSGCEAGMNRLGNVDTMQRYIYIHGCPDDISLAKPSSHGCIRMHNKAVIELFDRVSPGTKVFIGDTFREPS